MKQIKKLTIVVSNEKGFHARAAAKFVKRLQEFDVDVEVQKGQLKVSGQSILELLLLAAGKGSRITLFASGKDADEALLSLKSLVEREKFQEE